MMQKFSYLSAIAAMESEQRRCDREWDVFTKTGHGDSMQIVDKQCERLKTMNEKYGISMEWRDGAAHISFAGMKS